MHPKKDLAKKEILGACYLLREFFKIFFVEYVELTAIYLSSKIYSLAKYSDEHQQLYNIFR
jgi:hypothetical protein